MTNRVTIRDIALLAGVSASTVSRALNDNPAISNSTKQRVRQACRALNYVPDLTAKGLTGHTLHTIGVVIPDSSNPYYATFCTAVEKRAAEKGYRVVLTNTLYDPVRERETVDGLLSRQVDGIVISACSPKTQEDCSTLTGDLPCIFLGNNHGPNCSYVEVDNERGSYEATQYLYQLGHRQITFLGGRSNTGSLEQRLNGYRRSMLLNGLVPEVLTMPPETLDSQKWCYETARDLLTGAQRPQAILAYSDLEALSVISAAESCSLQVPEQLSLIGFNDIVLAKLPQIRLTTVSQHTSRLGQLIVDRLLEKINGENHRTADVLDPELKIRSTCQRI